MSLESFKSITFIPFILQRKELSDFPDMIYIHFVGKIQTQFSNVNKWLTPTVTFFKFVKMLYTTTLKMETIKLIN